MESETPVQASTLPSIVELDLDNFHGFNFHKLLGTGGNADVYEASHSEFWNAASVAVRIESMNNEEKIGRHNRMVQVLSQFAQCPYVVRMIGHGLIPSKLISISSTSQINDRNNLAKSAVKKGPNFRAEIADLSAFSTGLLVMQICSSTVDDWITSSHNNVNEEIDSLETSMPLITSTAVGLEAVHREKVVHRDIHGGNVFLSFDPKDPTTFLHTVIGDFALAFIQGDYQIKVIHRCLSPPENSRTRRYDSSGDVYQFGIFVACCVLRKRLEGNNLDDFLFIRARDDSYQVSTEEIGRIREEMTDRLSNEHPEFLSLFLSSVDENPANRPTMHEWVQKLVPLYGKIVNRLSKVNSKLRGANRKVEEAMSKLAEENRVLKEDRDQQKQVMNNSQFESSEAFKQLRTRLTELESQKKSHQKTMDELERLKGDFQRAEESRQRYENSLNEAEKNLEKCKLSLKEAEQKLKEKYTPPSINGPERTESIPAAITQKLTPAHARNHVSANSPTPTSEVGSSSELRKLRRDSSGFMESVNPYPVNGESGGGVVSKLRNFFEGPGSPRTIQRRDSIRQTVFSDGKVYACGSNNLSALANSYPGKLLSPENCNLLPVGVKITQICGRGMCFVLFLTSDGKVLAVGNNQFGQLGIGHENNQERPIPVQNLDNVILIAAGESHSLFLHSTSKVSGCGWNKFGQLGDGTISNRNVPVPVLDISEVKAVACGVHHSLYLKRNGSVWISGVKQFDDDGNPSSPEKAPIEIILLGGNVTSISCGFYHSLCLHSDFTVSSFGRNQCGQLGNGRIESGGGIDSIFKIQIENILSISCGGSHSLFLQRGSTVLGCGWNRYGQLGDEKEENRVIPGRISISNDVIQVEGGGAHSLFAHRTGKVSGCGNNELGQLGIGNMQMCASPMQIPNIANVKSVSCSEYCSYFLAGPSS